MQQEPDEQVLLSLVQYLPIQSIQSLSLVNKNRLLGREAVGIVKDKYSTAGRDLYTDREKRTQELAKAISNDDLYTLEHILAYSSDAPISYILTLAAMYRSRRVYLAIAPMLTDALNKILADDTTEDDEFMDMLYDLTVTTLETDDPEFYEAFFSALENTTSSASGLLVGGVLGPDIIHDLVWYAYLGVVTGQDTGAYAVVKKYLGASATPEYHPLLAFEQIQTPALIKYIVETGQYREGVVENNYKAYTSGEMTYEEVLDVEMRKKEAGLREIISKMSRNLL